MKDQPEQVAKDPTLAQLEYRAKLVEQAVQFLANHVNSYGPAMPDPDESEFASPVRDRGNIAELFTPADVRVELEDALAAAAAYLHRTFGAA